jgi:drug/metabolite transporter (DMT)-like permease
MIPEWLIFALIFPALFAVVNIIDDNFLRNVYRSSYFGAIISGFFGMLPLIGIFFFPVSMASFPIVLLGISAGFLTVIYYLFYFKALEAEFPSVVIAFFNLTPVFALIIAYFFLGEQLTRNHFLGFLLILGVYGFINQ